MVLFELWFFFLFGVIFLLIYIPQTKKEENALLERFGQEYREYCKAAHKYFPRFDYLLKLNKYISLKPFWIRKEIVSMVATVTVVVSIKIWEYIRLSGYKQHERIFYRNGILNICRHIGKPRVFYFSAASFNSVYFATCFERGYSRIFRMVIG